MIVTHQDLPYHGIKNSELKLYLELIVDVEVTLTL